MHNDDRKAVGLAANALSAVKNRWKTVVAVSLLSWCWCFFEIEVMTKAMKSEASNGVYCSVW